VVTVLGCVSGWGCVMIARGYAIFDSAIGRCGIAWSHAGFVGVQLPEAREIDTRRRLYRLYPEARELSPPSNAEHAIEGIAAVLRGEDCDLADVTLDMEGILPFNRRVYDYVRGIPRGETRTYQDIEAELPVTGVPHSVAQAIAKNPFMIIVPCHRVLERAGSHGDGTSAYGGTISKRHLLAIEGVRPTVGKTLFDALLPVAPPRPHP
jgi:methylated-DNA-[protein]-cysteine S-methyltransferase